MYTSSKHNTEDQKANVKWACHMVKGKDKNIKILTKWYARQGKRRKGRPKQR